MAKRNVFLHIGPTLDGFASSQDALRASTTIAAAGLVVPAVDVATLERADLEIRRAHKAAGLKSRDVEGSWSTACRKAWKITSKQKADAVISIPGLIAATRDQAALALDGLHGMRVHLLVTAGADTDVDPSPWLDVLGKASLVHRVSLSSPGVDDLAAHLAGLALEVETARVERKLAKWTARSAVLARRLRRLDVA